MDIWDGEMGGSHSWTGHYIDFGAGMDVAAMGLLCSIVQNWEIN